MRTDLLYMLGAGGHAKVVIDTLDFNGLHRLTLVLRDDNPVLEGTLVLSNPVYYPALTEAGVQTGFFHVAVGNNRIRQRLFLEMNARAHQPLSIISNRAAIAKSATLKEGTFVAPFAVVAAESKVDEGCIVNHGAIVDHECNIGAFCHIAPGAVLGGGVNVGAGSFIGAGAKVLPEITLGNNVIIGAGAVVNHPVLDDQCVVGVPARPIRKFL